MKKKRTMKNLFNNKEVTLDAKAIRDLRESNLTIGDLKKRYNIISKRRK